MKLTSLLPGILAIAGAAYAQDAPARVARLNLVNGPVSFQPASVDDWTSATLNYPLTTGDHLYADQGATAEMHIGSNAIRLAAQTNFGFLNLDDQTAQVRLTQGSIGVRLRNLADQDVWEIDTPNGAISLLGAGNYRVDTDPDRNATMVTVRAGSAEVTANGQSFTVRSGETAFFAGDGGQPDIKSANPEDSFDAFCADRDRREDTLPAPRYVSRDMVGYEDLDTNGSWSVVQDYGPVWRPRAVAADWAPYRNGHWAWVEPWGWTWIDDASWGFAPFHYGRWAYIGGGWGWCPGEAFVSRPVYAPALVAFVGGGGWSASLSLGGGGVAWFPLGPREVYVPPYHYSDAYVRRVNVMSVGNINSVNFTQINVNRVYVNQRVPGAVIAVSRADFAGARPVSRVGVRVDGGMMASARVSLAGPGIAPERVSVFGRAGGPMNVARPREAVFNRTVFARSAPPPPAVSFAARQQAIQANGGRPLDPGALRGLQSQGQVSRPDVRSASQVGAPTGAGFGRSTARPAQQQPANPNGSFGRAPDRMNSRPPGIAPAPQAAPPVQAQPAAPNGGYGRRQQDRIDPRPPLATPVPAPVPATNPNPGFGRAQERPQAVEPRQQPAPIRERVQERAAPAEPRAAPQEHRAERAEKPYPADKAPVKKDEKEKPKEH